LQDKFIRFTFAKNLKTIIMEKEFTIDDAIRIQRDQLLAWRKVLTPEAYGDLVIHAEQNNRTTKDPNKITRGSDLSVFVNNYANNIKPIDNNAPMTKMTADDLRRLRHGDRVHYGNGSNIRSLQYVGRMPRSEEHYLIFSEGEFLMHLYIGHDDKFRGDWFMGKYDSEFVGNYLKDWHLERIKGIDEIYLKKEDK
jgi:hypothetical protein